MSGIPIRVDGTTDNVLLASSCNGMDSHAGLSAFDGAGTVSVDMRNTTGLYAGGGYLFRLLQPVPGYPTDMLVFEAHGAMSTWKLETVFDPHDVLWDGQHALVVCSSRNTINWFSPGGVLVKQWTAATLPDEFDAWHINCLALRGEEVFVSAFGRFQRHREWADHMQDPTGIMFNLKTGKDVLTGLLHPHSPRPLHGGWIICDSKRRDVVQYNRDGDVERRSGELAHYTRGLAQSDDLLFVGESLSRSDGGADSAPESVTGSIAVLRRDTLELVDRVAIPSREVYDLVIVKRAFYENMRHLS